MSRTNSNVVGVVVVVAAVVTLLSANLAVSGKIQTRLLELQQTCL